MNLSRLIRLAFAIVLVGSFMGCTPADAPRHAATPPAAPTLAVQFVTQVAPGVAASSTPTLQETDFTGVTPQVSATPHQPAAPLETQPPRPASETAGPRVEVDLLHSRGSISPLIYGLSGGEGAYIDELRPAFRSWGGNTSTRYNWKLGNAWNAARDWFYQNGSYGVPDGVSAADDFLLEARSAGAATRLAVPTLGWVARDTTSCSFPNPDGSCGDAGGASCQQPGAIADPKTASIESDPASIAAWMLHLKELDALPTIAAMDNEPELWGFTHYDVHPGCTTYEEILEKYLAYAQAVRTAAPQVLLAGPVTCCWFSYWKTAPGPAVPGPEIPQDFIAWFLQAVRRHDEASGGRLLDALDVHFYPQAGVYNDATDPDTAARRLRSTRALWDAAYTDESWIDQPIYFIPRMRALIDEYYPGTQLGISEWNWGADTSINGALAIAEVLGIFGREGVDYAAYWRNPPQDSPGFLAFKLFTNYDGLGAGFSGSSVPAVSSAPDALGSFAAYDASAGQLKLLLINKDPGSSADVSVTLDGFQPQAFAHLYRLAAANPQAIVRTDMPLDAGDFTIHLPAYSITLMVMTAR